MRWMSLLIAAALAGMPAASRACDLCTPQGAPLSYEKSQAKIVVFGHITKANLGPNGVGGSSELTIDKTLKDDDTLLKNQKSLTLDRFVPVDPKIKYLIFVDVNQGALDPYRGISFGTDRVVKYLEKLGPYDPKADLKTRTNRIRFLFDFLHDEEPEIASDAFKEFAITRNEDVGHAAKSLDPKKLRAWIDDKKTPPVRLSLYAYLLGACGNDDDAKRLRGYIEKKDERMAGALDGVLAGLISLKPDEGWKLTLQVLGDPNRGFTERLTVLRMLRFYHAFQPKESRPHILDAAQILLDQPEVLDLIVGQLQAWEMWDKTDVVLSKFQKKDAPITKRAIVRYALTCPLPAAQKFLDELAKDPKEKKMIEEVREGLPRRS